MSTSEIKARFKSAALASAKPIPVETVAFGLIYVRRLSVAEVQERRKEVAEASEISSLLARGICDEHGSPVFSAASVDDIGVLNELLIGDVTPILAAINTSSGLGEAGQEAAAKN